MFVEAHFTFFGNVPIFWERFHLILCLQGEVF